MFNKDVADVILNEYGEGDIYSRKQYIAHLGLYGVADYVCAQLDEVATFYCGLHDHANETPDVALHLSIEVGKVLKDAPNTHQ